MLSKASLLKGELELNGRLLVVLPQVAKTRVDDVVQANKDAMKNTGEDKRNLSLKKEGLLNEKAWVHQEPALTSKDLEQRQRLFIEKDTALKKSPNLSVSKTRLQIRNLPKRDFYEAELRELCVAVIDAFKEQQGKASVKLPKLKTLIKQVKVLRDGEKTELDEQKQLVKLSSGLAFAEFSEPEVALYAVRYLNNMQLNGARGLVVDFCLEDARKLHARDQKLHKH